MLNTILGQKGEMEARYNARGHRVPVTIISVDPNVVLDVKSGHATLGLGAKKKIKKSENAFVAKVGVAPRFIKEVKLEGPASPDATLVDAGASRGGEIKIGDKINVSIFSLQDEVKVTGTTKGRGFTGGVKRWGFHGGPKTHGQSDRHRAPGSIGMGTTPGRVFKGKHMAGHMGNKKITITGLEVIEVDPVKNLLVLKGSVPGAKNGYLIVQKTGKVKKYIAPPEEKPRPEDDQPLAEKEDEEPSSAKASEGKEESREPKETKEDGKENG